MVLLVCRYKVTRGVKFNCNVFNFLFVFVFYCADNGSKLRVKFTTCKPEHHELSARLCLYGEAELPRITVQPDALYFTDMTVDGRQVCVCAERNDCRINFALRSRPYAPVVPQIGCTVPSTTTHHICAVRYPTVFLCIC